MRSDEREAPSALERVKEILFTPIPLFGKPSKGSRRRARRLPVRRAEASEKPIRSQFHLTGVLGAGQTTKFAIAGEDIVIDEDTWIFGEVRLGGLATVKGEKIGAQNFAKKLTMS